MRADHIVATQLLIAQAIGALAQSIDGATGYALTPVLFAGLPVGALGMIACVTDSTVNTPGAVIVGGGTNVVLAFYNGTSWKVVAA